jgi:general secretion pathway protein D
MFRLDFRGTNIDTVLQAFALAFKWTVVKDPACTGEVTVIETEPMDHKRALEVLQALLEVRGFTAKLDGKILKVMSLKRAVSTSTTVRVAKPGDMDSGDTEVIRQVIPLSNAEAPALAKDLQPLVTEGASIIGLAGANALIITDTASNVAALRQIIQALDKGAGNTEWKIFHLKHVPAKKMVEIINELFKQIAPRTPPAPMGQPGQPQPPPQPGQRPNEPRSAVAAVEDERTNSIIVVGSEDNLDRVSEIVKELDEGLNPHTETKVYEVKFAEALKLAQMLNDALVGGMAAAQPAAQPSFNPFGNPFERRAQGTQTASFSVGQTRIVADTRTNKLVITADEDTMKKVEELLAQLDQQVEYSTTTFAIKLKNGNAEDMAYILAQAFGTQSPQLLNPFFGGFFGGFGGGGRESRRDRRIRRRVGSSDQRADAGLGAGPALAAAGAATGFKPEVPAGPKFADASGGNGDLPPELQRLAQFIYDPYYGQRRGGSDATTGRTASGRYVNLLQLRGNVLVTPERNTNSLIITTSPENEAAVRDLIADLDVEVKQVLLEALVVEVTLDRERKFGIDYLFQNLRDKVEGVFPVLSGTGPLGAGLASGLRATIVRGDFRAIVTAVDKDDRIRILSTPSVFTANNQEAEIEVTDSIPYLRGNTVGFGGQTSSSVDFIDVGLILNVTPRITADGMVAVDVYQEDSNLVEFRDVGNEAVAPITTQRVTDTSVTLRDGDTLVLSGLQKTEKNNQKSKIPILGDLPLVGGLFRSTARRERRTELIVFLTPRVINNADEARSLSQQELDRVQKDAPEAMPRAPKPERKMEP